VGEISGKSEEKSAQMKGKSGRAVQGVGAKTKLDEKSGESEEENDSDADDSPAGGDPQTLNLNPEPVTPRP
jgi:hypothetical protein